MNEPTAVTVLDGGMGRHLLAMGAPFRQPEWSALALIEAPESVERAHRDFIDSGAHVITTNSYALVPFHVGAGRFAADGERLAALAGRLARRAADSVAHDVQVAGSLPPLFGSYQPERFDAERAPTVIDPLVRALSPHIDLWLGETLSSCAEAQGVRDALTRAGDHHPLWLSFTLHRQPGESVSLRSGESIATAVAMAGTLGASAVLFNCCEAELIDEALDAARAVAAGLKLGAYANRFAVAHTDEPANGDLSDMRGDLSIAAYRALAGSWVAKGATIVGGCCGIGPDYIRALAAHVA